jgi:hypothetical protein
MTYTPILALVAAASIIGSSAHAAPTPNTISFTTFPSDTQFTTNPISVAASATAGVPMIRVVSGSAVYTNGAIKLTGTGLIKVSASQTVAPPGYALPIPVTNSFTVSALPNTITFSSTISDTTYTTNPISLTASSAAGTPVIRVTSGAARYTNGGIILTGVGPVTVSASQTNAPAGYSIPSTIQQTFNVSALSNTISFSQNLSDTPYTTNPIALTASSIAGTPKITVVSGNARYTNGAIRLTGIGSVTVSASQTNAPTGYSLPTTIQQTFNVTALSNTISFTQFPNNPTTYTTNALSVAAIATAGTPSISVTGPASYNATTKKIILSGSGDVTVTASVTNTPVGYAPATALQQSFTVGVTSNTIANFAPIASTNWNTNPPVITIPIPRASSGLPVTLSVVSGGTLTGSNKVTASAAGTITVAADQAGNNKYGPADRVTTTITVNPGSNSITAFGSASPTNPVYGGTFTIAVPTGKASTPVTVTASGASVSQSGDTVTVTPTSAGPVTLYANQEADSNWRAAGQIQKIVTVAKQIPVITPASDQSITYSKSLSPITITPSSTSSGAFSFSVTGPATVGTNSGVVSISGAGTVVVKAKQSASADGNYAPVTNSVTVSTITVGKGSQTITTPNIPTPANGTSFTLPILNSDQDLPCTYGVTGATYAPLARKVTVSSAGTISITASQAGTNNYLPIGPVNVVTFTATKSGAIYSFSRQ